MKKSTVLLSFFLALEDCLILARKNGAKFSFSNLEKGGRNCAKIRTLILVDLGAVILDFDSCAKLTKLIHSLPRSCWEHLSRNTFGSPSNLDSGLSILSSRGSYLLNRPIKYFSWLYYSAELAIMPSNEVGNGREARQHKSLKWSCNFTIQTFDHENFEAFFPPLFFKRLCNRTKPKSGVL